VQPAVADRLGRPLLVAPVARITSSPRPSISPSSAIRTLRVADGGPTVSSLIPRLGRLQLTIGAVSGQP
jgi:hypothetical protein